MKKITNNSKISHPLDIPEPDSPIKLLHKIKIHKKPKGSPLLDKAKEIIEDRNLFKLKHFLVKTGAIKNK